ncbi:MAG: MBL fold metallo-hydrolase [Candidatus Zambryskibacteria bacterium]|nr:MBL fold metallo-hydrolase [Candidatus Zambryskibacteria bacterium]
MEEMQPFKNRWREALVASLIVANLFVWLAVSLREERKELRVYFIDVGQGDAILIESPTRGRVLIDGGRNRQVVSELGRILPFGDKRIDVVIATHPDADHIGGLPEVVRRYKVGIFVEPGVRAESSLDEELDARLREKNISQVLASRGQVINFGDGATLTILFPDRDVSEWDTNDASIVARLDYGESPFLFTGDAGIQTENILMSIGREVLDTDILKAGHHGSRTSTSLTFAEVVTPEYTIISAGKGNSYGHPHKEVLSILERVGSQIKNTALSGTIIFETDGEILRLK